MQRCSTRAQGIDMMSIILNPDDDVDGSREYANSDRSLEISVRGWGSEKETRVRRIERVDYFDAEISFHRIEVALGTRILRRTFAWRLAIL